MNLPSRQTIKIASMLLVMVVIVGAVGVWAGGYPSQLSRFF